MKNCDPSLNRLLRAAANHPVASTPEEAPYGFATRVVACWKEAATNGRGLEAGVQILWFRRTLMCALAVMAISVGWSFTSYTNDAASSGDEMAMASYDASADLP